MVRAPEAVMQGACVAAALGPVGLFLLFSRCFGESCSPAQQDPFWLPLLLAVLLAPVGLALAGFGRGPLRRGWLIAGLAAQALAAPAVVSGQADQTLDDEWMIWLTLAALLASALLVVPAWRSARATES